MQGSSCGRPNASQSLLPPFIRAACRKRSVYTFVSPEGISYRLQTDLTWAQQFSTGAVGKQASVWSPAPTEPHFSLSSRAPGPPADTCLVTGVLSVSHRAVQFACRGERVAFATRMMPTNLRRARVRWAKKGVSNLPGCHGIGGEIRQTFCGFFSAA